jgi:hypothetical protein
MQVYQKLLQIEQIESMGISTLDSKRKIELALLNREMFHQNRDLRIALLYIFSSYDKREPIESYLWCSDRAILFFSSL